MPTRAQYERMMGGYDEFPMYEPPQRSRSLLDLTMQQGDLRAQQALQRGDFWANTIANIGQGIGQALEKRDTEKKLRRRDAAWVDFVGRGEWSKDPQRAYAETVRIWGPEEGPKQFQALVGVSQLMQPKRDAAADQKALGAVGGAMSKMDDAGRAQLWPQAVALTKNAFPHVELPQQYDPKVWEHVQPLFAQLSGEKPAESFTLSPGQQRFGPDGRPLASVPETPKEQPGFSLGPGEVRYDASGKPIASRPAAPREPKESRLVPQKTVNAAGQEVIRWVTPKPGEEFVQPTGQGRPASGQQRKALSFFNRGKEAGEIADALEDADKISPLALKYVPDFANVMLSKEDQQYKQAQRAFTEARLRKESGATIKDEEYENDAMTYFPQPGDDKTTKAQKRAMRREVLRGIALESGDALREFYGDDSESVLQNYGGPGMRSKGSAPAPLAPSEDALLKKYGY